MEVKNSTISYEYITRTTKQIKKSSLADFLMHFYAFMLLFIEDAIDIDGIEDTF